MTEYVIRWHDEWGNVLVFNEPEHRKFVTVNDAIKHGWATSTTMLKGGLRMHGVLDADLSCWSRVDIIHPILGSATLLGGPMLDDILARDTT